MKKPDYCPAWFDIDLYDNLAHQPRDALAFALWSRRMNYKGYFSDIERYREGGDNGDITEETLKCHALEWLKMMATQWNVEPVKYKGSHQVKESYDPLKVEPNIISDVTLMDIACLYAYCYFELPHMREFFQKAPVVFDEAIKHGYVDQACESAECVLEDKCATPQLEYETAVSDCFNYADMFVIDLSQSDDVLKMAFEQKLKEIRAKEQKHPFWGDRRTKRFSEAEIRRIVEYRVFAYIDLYIYGQIIGRKFTDIEMAAMIYPPRENTPLDFDAVDRISRTVKPKAIELLEKTNPRLLL